MKHTTEALASAPHDHTKACAVCGTPLEDKRPDARYCGATCRKRASRGTSASIKGVTSPERPLPPAEPVSRLSARLRPTERHSSGPSEPQFIQSDWTGRIYPRTYAEFGLPLPDHLRANPRP